MLLRELVDSYFQVQKARIAMSNRLSAIDRQADTVRPLDRQRIEHWQTRFQSLEDEIASAFTDELDLHPAWPWLHKVKGIGPTLGAKLLGLIGDISKAPTVSSLWRFAGQDPTADKLVKGVPAQFNRRLKTVCFLIGRSMLMVNSPYRRLYDEAKAKYHDTHPEWTKGHRHHAARRYMVKIFLSHLWVTWRQAVGLPTSEPYALTQPGHTKYYSPDEFVK